MRGEGSTQSQTKLCAATLPDDREGLTPAFCPLSDLTLKFFVVQPAAFAASVLAQRDSSNLRRTGSREIIQKQRELHSAPRRKITAGESRRWRCPVGRWRAAGPLENPSFEDGCNVWLEEVRARQQ